MDNKTSQSVNRVINLPGADFNAAYSDLVEAKCKDRQSSHESRQYSSHVKYVGLKVSRVKCKPGKCK